MMMTFLARWRDYLISDNKQDEKDNLFRGRIYFVLGKGGTGKTTISSALGLSLAEKGERVLMVSLDQAHNLGDVFNIYLPSVPEKIESNLYGLELDLKAARKDYLQKTRNQLKSIYKYLSIFNLDNILDIMADSPGMEEFVMLESIINILKEKGDYDSIIFDTAPTGTTLKMLTLPQLTGKWIKELINLRKKILDKRETIENIQGKQYVTAKEEKIELPSIEEEDAVLGNLNTYNKKMEWIEEILISPEITGGIIVLNTDRLSLLETERTVSKLKQMEFPIDSLVLNKWRARENKDNLQEQLNREYGSIKIIKQEELKESSVSREDLLNIGDKIYKNMGLQEVDIDE